MRQNRLPGKFFHSKRWRYFERESYAQGGSAANLYENVWGKVLSLPDSTQLYPAHDYKGLSVTFLLIWMSLVCWPKSVWPGQDHSGLFVIFLLIPHWILTQGWLAPRLERRSSTTHVWRSRRRSSSRWWPASASPTPRRSTRACRPTWCAAYRTFLRGWRTGSNWIYWSDFTFVWYIKKSLLLLYWQNIWEQIDDTILALLQQQLFWEDNQKSTLTRKRIFYICALPAFIPDFNHYITGFQSL